MSAATSPERPRPSPLRMLCVLLAGALLPLAAASASDGMDHGAGVDAVLLGVLLNDHNPFVPGARRTRFRATILLHEQDVRIDFSGPAGERGMLLHDGQAATGWLVDLDAQLAVPMPLAGQVFARLRVDPERPCAGFGVRCEPASPRYIAGQPRKGYGFRDAAGRGPGGLSRGEFWVDDAHGVILAYHGTGRGAREASAMDADLVRRQQVPESDFRLPDVIEVAQ